MQVGCVYQIGRYTTSAEAIITRISSIISFSIKIQTANRKQYCLVKLSTSTITITITSSDGRGKMLGILLCFEQFDSEIDELWYRISISESIWYGNINVGTLDARVCVLVWKQRVGHRVYIGSENNNSCGIYSIVVLMNFTVKQYTHLTQLKLGVCSFVLGFVFVFSQFSES